MAMHALHELLIVVALPHDADGEALARHLRRFSGRIEHVWPPPDALEKPADLVFVATGDLTRPLMASLIGSPRTAVIGVASAPFGGGRDMIPGGTPHAVLFKPLDGGSVMATIEVALGNFGYQRRLQGKVAKLEETLRSMRKVERAKAILMKRRRIDEPTAYAFLRDQAMRKRVPIGVVASSVIDSNEVLPTE